MRRNSLPLKNQYLTQSLLAQDGKLKPKKKPSILPAQGQADKDDKEQVHIRRKSTEYWFKSDRQSSLQDVLMMMSKRKRDLASGKTSKKAPMQTLPPTPNPPLKRKNLMKKESFLKAHDRLENYHVCIELTNIRFAPECQLLADCESILVKIDRG